MEKSDGDSIGAEKVWLITVSRATSRGGLGANRVVYAAVLIEPTVFCYEPRELAENLLP